MHSLPHPNNPHRIVPLDRHAISMSLGFGQFGQVGQASAILEILE